MGADRPLGGAVGFGDRRAVALAARRRPSGSARGSRRARGRRPGPRRARRLPDRVGASPGRVESAGGHRQPPEEKAWRASLAERLGFARGRARRDRALRRHRHVPRREPGRVRGAAPRARHLRQPDGAVPGVPRGGARSRARAPGSTSASISRSTPSGPRYRWGPVAGAAAVPSLVDGRGDLPAHHPRDAASAPSPSRSRSSCARRSSARWRPGST